ILLLPVFLSVIYIGFQQWRKPKTQLRSSASNHSDNFTFNITALEVFGVLGSCIIIVSSFTSHSDLAVSGGSLMYMVYCGQIFFHNLMCLEQYLAVVHPITYLRLKKNRKLIRNSCIIAAWLVIFCMVIVFQFRNPVFNFLSVFLTTVISLLSITFFCVSVLCVLIRPGPGGRGRVHQSKRRAFYTITAITMVLFVKFGIMFASHIIGLAKALTDFKACMLAVSARWLNTPSSLV
ncbi:hypothetical protein NQD34_013377, partial [Periophthalmus magnuspinnatus]